MRGALLPMWTALLVALPLAGQSLEVKPARTQATLGDPIVLDITVRLRPGMELIDEAPRTLVPPPRGTRILRSDTLQPAGNGTYRGKAVVAFYRLGPQPVPTLSLLYRKAAGEPPDTLLHLPVSVEIVSTLEAGNPRLKDIKPLQPLGGPIWLQTIGLLAAVALGFAWLWRRGRRRAALRAAPVAPLAGPFDAAIARLAELQAAAEASGNGVVPLYAAVADVVRDCLRTVGAVPHPGLTTRELGERLPPWLGAGGRRGQCEAVLSEADLVKFAKVRPDLRAATEHVARTRTLLEGFRDAVTPPIPGGEA